MDDPGVLPDIAAMSFEDALAELEQIVGGSKAVRSSWMRPSSATSAGPGSNCIAKESSTRRSKGSRESLLALTAPFPRSRQHLTETLWPSEFGILPKRPRRGGAADRHSPGPALGGAAGPGGAGL